MAHITYGMICTDMVIYIVWTIKYKINANMKIKHEK